jgi:predicted ribosome quality control (RQC) complex YloA/Tae2 family protein
VVVVACEICAYYSKGRSGGKTEIVYTEKKNVKKPPRSKSGFVSYDNFKSMVVNPEKHVEFLKCD